MKITDGNRWWRKAKIRTIFSDYESFGLLDLDNKAFGRNGISFAIKVNHFGLDKTPN